jgi:hypothetical protein
MAYLFALPAGLAERSVTFVILARPQDSQLLFLSQTDFFLFPSDCL